MPRRTQTTRRHTVGNPIHDIGAAGRTQSGFLVKSYWPENAEGDRIAYAGAICAFVSGGILEQTMTGAQNYIVPYSAAATYGTGSDTPAGILAETWDETYSNWLVNLVNRGTAIEKYCYMPGHPTDKYGGITDIVKTALTLITWRS